MNLPGCGSSPDGSEECTSLDCLTSKYNLLIADIDGNNISVLLSSSWQDMTHPRVSADRNWVAYTTYNTADADGCAFYHTRTNTEIRVVSMDGTKDKPIIPPVVTEINSNSYWYGSANEFTFLSGAGGATKLYRAQLDTLMNLVSGPAEIPVPPAIIPPLDPAAQAATWKNRLCRTV